jgi:D-methionine transport system ATP-binding protein
VEEGPVADIFSNPREPITREFLSHLNPMEDASVSREAGTSPDLVRWSEEGGAYTLRFRGSLTGEPVLSKLSKNYDIEFNIRAGGVQNVGGTAVGTLVVDITGDRAEVDRALVYLASEGIIVEENK